MSDQDLQLRRERCRREVLAFLVTASPCAFSLVKIQNRINEGGDDFTPTEVAAALEFRVSAGHVLEQPCPVGSTKYYKATAAGVLAHERGA